MKVLMQVFFTDNGHKRTKKPLKMTSFCNTSKDNLKPVLSFNLTPVNKKSKLRSLSFIHSNHKVNQKASYEVYYSILISMQI